MKADHHIIPPFLRQHLPAIRQLCIKHKVKQLWVFGSILREDFSAESDVDFLYEMDDANIAENQSYECFWGFFDALQKLLRREIDMVWYFGIKNPYFREEVDETKVLIYDPRSERVFV